MLVEALLFFNPAVWWLGRQARLERRGVLCDAQAVRLTGRPLGPFPRPCWLAWPSGCGQRPRPSPRPGGAARALSPLLERVLRVLRPDEPPRTRVTWAGLVVLLLLGPLLLAGLWRGTTVAVVLAAQVLSPAERMEKLKQAEAAYALPLHPEKGKATLKGTIRVPGGRPPPRPSRRRRTRGW